VVSVFGKRYINCAEAARWQSNLYRGSWTAKPGAQGVQRDVKACCVDAGCASLLIMGTGQSMVSIAIIASKVECSPHRGVTVTSKITRIVREGIHDRQPKGLPGYSLARYVGGGCPARNADKASGTAAGGYVTQM